MVSQRNLIALDTMAGSSTDNFQKEGQDSVFSQYPAQDHCKAVYGFEVSKGKSFMEDCLAKFGPGNRRIHLTGWRRI